jgi:Ser/Thr protein kinase RdoA (MazF antagonist)
MDIEKAVRAHIEGVLGLAVNAPEDLGVTAYNHHYRIRVDGHDRHLVIYHLPESLPLAGLRFEHRIIRLLRQAGFHQAPELVVHDGNSLFHVGEVYYALTEWIDGCHDQPDLEISTAQLDGSARTLADLHRATAHLEARLDYFQEHIFVYTTPHFLEAHGDLLRALRERVASAPPETFDEASRQRVEPFVERARQFLRRFDASLFARVRASDPTGVVHGDYRRMNLVFSADDVVKVLDYNCCFNDIRLWDVAYSALSFGGHETVGPLHYPGRAADFIRAYHRSSPLTEAEQALLPDYLCFVPIKLMTAAMESWWINDRAEMVERLLDGQAQAVVDSALSAE